MSTIDTFGMVQHKKEDNSVRVCWMATESDDNDEEEEPVRRFKEEPMIDTMTPNATTASDTARTSALRVCRCKDCLLYTSDAADE